MPSTTPKLGLTTWAASDPFSVSQLSTNWNLVDTFANAHASQHNAGGTDPLTVISASILTSGTLPLARLAMPGAKVFNNAVAAMTNITWTAVPFNSELYDFSTPMHDNVTNNSRVTSQVTGKYIISASISFTASNVAAPIRGIKFRLNGTTDIARVYGPGIQSATEVVDLSLTTVYNLAAGDYVECMGYQNSNGALNLLASSAYSPYMAVHWIAG